MAGCLAAFFVSALSLHAQPQALQGLIDLSSADLTGAVYLNGDWEFRWNDLSEPGEVTPLGAFMRVPGAWRGTLPDGTSIPPTGYATYRLRVRFPSSVSRFALRVPIMGTSYQLYAGKDLIASNGKPGTTAETTVPEFRPIVTSAIPLPASGEIVLTLHIANFHDRSGGPWQPIEIGTERAVRSAREQILSRDLVLCGALLIMGLYHLGLFLVRRQDNLPAFFGAFCLIMALRTLSEGEKYITTLVPGLEWVSAVRLSYGTFYIAIPLFLHYFARLFPLENSKRLTQLVALLMGCLTGFVFVAPVRLFSETLPLAHLITLLLAAYCIGINVLSIKRKRPHARLFLIALCVFGATVAHDILAGYSVTPSGIVLAPAGLFLFIFAQAYLLSVRFSRAFLQAEQLSRDLDRLNADLELRIEQRNRELSLTLKAIKRDLATARKIQQAFLPRTESLRGLVVDFIYLPMEEVGGDIFDFLETERGVWRCFLADATGHGVQGALVTMALKSEFESLSLHLESPAALLRELNRSFAEKFSAAALFASAVVVDILADGRIRYASAGHPDQWIVGQDRLQVLSRTGPVLGIAPSAVYHEVDLDLSPSETIFLYSDGAFEHLDVRDDVGEQRLISLIASTARDSAEMRMDAIRSHLLGVLEEGRQDDVTVLAVSRPASPAPAASSG